MLMAKNVNENFRLKIIFLTKRREKKKKKTINELNVTLLQNLN